MIFLYYQPFYFLTENNEDPFHFINGELHPIKGAFTDATPSRPVWWFHIGV